MSGLRDLAEQALRVRRAGKVTMDGPVNPIDLAASIGVVVRFLDVSMEGTLLAGSRPSILLSSLRPIGRRAFTCAHELGHYTFGHGSTIDEVKKAAGSGQFQPEEYLADTFAGFLLMPPPGIRRGFMNRGLKIASPSATDVARVASAFGVGFETLVTQLAAQKEITEQTAKALRRTGPSGARHQLLGRDGSKALHYVDEHFESPTLDLEEGDLVLLPGDVAVGPLLCHAETLAAGKLYVARGPGIDRAWASNRGWSMFVRASRPAYVGLAAYRHLEDQDA